MSSFWTSAGLLVIGAAISFVPTFLADRERQRAALATRWDVPLQAQCGELLASAQKFDNLASRSAARPDDADLRAQVVAEHSRLRALAEQVRLLGSLDLQRAVRYLVRHAYAVRETSQGGVDRRAEEYGGRSPRGRLLDSVAEVRLAARVQLRVVDPDRVFLEPD